MAKLLDANAIIRFLLNDIPEQADKTANVIYDGAFTKEIVIAEVVYVLSGVYNYSRTEISNELLKLLELVSIEKENVVRESLNLFKETSLDFVDCILISYNKIENIEIFSFDSIIAFANSDTSSLSMSKIENAILTADL